MLIFIVVLILNLHIKQVEINIKTLECNPAEFIEKKTITFEEALKIQNGTYKSEVLKKPNHVYISALNKENALKRYHEEKGSATLPKAMFNLKDLM